MTGRTTLSTRARAVAAALLALLAALAWPQTVAAHTEFESSVPADGAVVEGPLTDVVLDFTNPARPAGDEFRLLDPSGDVRLPTSVDETDGTSFVLTFDPPLTTGTYGVRWEVQAGDAHPIDGSFRFDVVDPSAPGAGSAATPSPAASVPPTTEAPTPVPTVTETDADLVAFLADEGSGDDGTAVGRVGRALTSLGLVFGLGAVAALVWVIRGRRSELLAQLGWVRLSGLVVATGGLLELAALHAAQSLPVLDVVDTRAGVAAVLKIVGGVAVLVGFHARAGRLVAPARSLSAAVVIDAEAPVDVDREPDSGYRWVPTGAAALGLAGFAVALVSFWFDGHTVSKGVWAVHAGANLIHLGAAAVWGGGVFAMTTVVWMRRRAGERAGLAAMVVRFSSIAAVSLAAVIVAGLVMTAMILDRPGDVVSTEWGRLLLAKTAVVAVAAGLGAFNHFRLRPALEQRPDDPTFAKELRVSLTCESIAFVIVLALTAWLVAAAM